MGGRISFLLVAAAMWAAPALTGCMDNTVSTGPGGAGGGGGTTATTGGGGTGGATTSSTTTTTGPLTCSAPVSNPEITGDCDLLQQNCPPGKTCIPGPTKTYCQSAGGLKGPGKTCNLANGTKECQAGLFCIGAGNIGICTRPCCKDNNEPCDGGDCNGQVDFGNTVVWMCSYSQQCDLFTPGTCPAGLKCQLVYTDKGLAVCTLPAPEDVPEGGACQFVNECGENQICYGGTCRYNCLLSGGGTEAGNGGCPDLQKCTDVLPEASGDVGVCVPM